MVLLLFSCQFVLSIWYTATVQSKGPLFIFIQTVGFHWNYDLVLRREKHLQYIVHNCNLVKKNALHYSNAIRWCMTINRVLLIFFIFSSSFKIENMSHMWEYVNGCMRDFYFCYITQTESGNIIASSCYNHWVVNCIVTNLRWRLLMQWHTRVCWWLCFLYFIGQLCCSTSEWIYTLHHIIIQYKRFIQAHAQ